MNPLCDFSHLKFIQKDFWESQFDREKKRPKTKRNNKKDVAKLILPPLMCYSWKKTKRWMTLIWFLYYKWVCWGFLFWLRCQKVFCWWPPASFLFFHAHTKKNPSASYLFNDGTTWAMSRWWICRMRQRARHQPRRNNCQHWVVVATHSVWCTKSNHLWNARKQIRTFLELNKAVLAWLGREKKNRIAVHGH